MINKINHLSFIMDGNVRWSKRNKNSIKKSYSKGAENLLKLAKHSFETHKIKYVSAFALSKHNLNRSKTLLDGIISTLEFYLDEIIEDNTSYNFNIKFIGDLNFFNKNIQNKINKIHNRKHKTKNILIIALNYSGQLDIINAAKKLNNKNNFIDLLSLKNIPNPDLLIRTGGYKRLSDFFLFQCSFTELFFVNRLWPDFNISSLNKIILNFKKIDRKFGK